MIPPPGEGTKDGRKGKVQIPIFYKILVSMIFIAMLPVVLLGIVSLGGTSSIVAAFGMLASVAVITLLTVVAVLMWSYFLARQITAPIEELSVVATAISRGDLRNTEISVMSSDEIGDLVAAFNRMVNTYRILDTLAKEEPGG